SGAAAACVSSSTSLRRVSMSDTSRMEAKVFCSAAISAEKSVAIVVPAYGTPRARVVATRARTGSLLVVELHREEAVRVGGAGAQCCGDHDGAGDLLLGGTGLLRVADVRIEAVRALGGRRDRDRDEFAELDGHHLVAGIEDGR